MKLDINKFSKLTLKEYNKYGIYCIHNNINNKIYIGSTTRFGRRRVTHISDLKNNKHSNTHLQNAWNKYGSHSFEFYIIETVEDFKLLLDREQFYLDLYRSYDDKIGYNIDISSRRNILSENTKIKIGHSNSIFYNSETKIVEMKHKIHNRIMNALDNPVKLNCKSISAIQREKAKRGERNGIIFDKEKEKWNLKISINGTRIYLGLFETEEKALNFKYYIASKYHIFDILFS